MKKGYLFLIVMIAVMQLALAHGETPAGEIGEVDLVSLLWKSAVIVIILIALLFMIFEHRLHEQKSKNIFHIICFSIVTLYVVGITGFMMYQVITTNIISWSKGPVHWHADFEVWVCGERISLPESEGLLNRVGTGTFHHHNDYRIHLEGTIMEREEATLGAFFRVIGGDLHEGHVKAPQEEGYIEVSAGDECENAPGEETKLKIFVNGEEEKHAEDYVISPYANVPPGDVIHVVFGTERMIKEMGHGS